ncbi:hypothetical protein CCACVL1_22744 [Corchorus capsularis]|uniref:Uncharacterized protein n=1 Tax=Corchorus capsularis TaxID=210143 RepID=A0A1R3GWT7_COCAP|nr:hypothetical protein CCACVL1_22744 [Corchorus capsularis]
MAIRRSMTQLNIKVPPPSPIPTATGSRSAANESLSRYLEKRLQVPDLLMLPESQDRHLQEQSSPPGDEIEFHSLVLRDSSAVERMLRSAREVGAFRIWCGGIMSKEEMKALVKEAERVFGMMEERDTGFRKYMGGDKEGFRVA